MLQLVPRSIKWRYASTYVTVKGNSLKSLVLWGPTCLVARHTEARRHLWQCCRAWTAGTRPQQPPLRLRPHHSRHAAVRLDARGRHGKVPRSPGRKHRPGSWNTSHQRERTVSGEVLESLVEFVTIESEHCGCNHSWCSRLYRLLFIARECHSKVPSVKTKNIYIFQIVILMGAFSVTTNSP